MKYAKLGSVSHGTLRTFDLLDTFVNLLDELDTEPMHQELRDEVRIRLDQFDGESVEEGDAELLDEVMHALNSFAPPFCYFGNTEGDGSDFGFWFDHEAFKQSVRDGETLKVGDLAEADEKLRNSDWDYVAVANDHGNVTIYVPTRKVEYTEVISVV